MSNELICPYKVGDEVLVKTSRDVSTRTISDIFEIKNIYFHFTFTNTGMGAVWPYQGVGFIYILTHATELSKVLYLETDK